MGRSYAPWGNALLAVLLFILLRFFQQVNAADFIIWLTGGFLFIAIYATFCGLYEVFEWNKILSIMQLPIGLYGNIERASAHCAEDIGLSFSNADGNGIPLASVDDNIIYYDGPGHISIRAPTNAGKTESSSANICFALGAHRNIISTAKGAELALLTAKYRRDILHQNVVIIDPWKLTVGYDLQSHDFNPIGVLVKYAANLDSEVIDKARGIALILIPEPKDASGDGKFFRFQARNLLTWTMVYLALLEADSGELVCNLPYLYNKISGGEEEFERFLIDMCGCNQFRGTVKRAGKKFLGKLRHNRRQADSILSEAENSLMIFDEASPLGQTMDYSDFDPDDLKKKPMSVYIVIPPEKGDTVSQFAGLCLNVLIDTCIKANSFEPRVTIAADEFAALSSGPMPAILPCIFLGRSRGVQLITYVQDTESYKSRYGDEASAFTTNSEIVMTWAVRSNTDSKEYSERAGQISVVTESNNVPMTMRDNSTDKYSTNISEKGIPAYRPDEIMQLPDFTALIYYRQHPAITAQLLSYRMVDPWVHYAGTVPGTPPQSDLPIIFKA